MKRCPKCDKDRDESEFYKDKRTLDGLKYRCKECSSKSFKKWYQDNPGAMKKINDKNKERRKLYYANPETKRKNRIGHLKRMFGITEELYLELERKQKNRCAICNEKETSKDHLAVDHCHKTNKIRGLLCNRCNRALGYLKEDISIFYNAINYLNKHK